MTPQRDMGEGHHSPTVLPAPWGRCQFPNAVSAPNAP